MATVVSRARIWCWRLYCFIVNNVKKLGSCALPACDRTTPPVPPSPIVEPLLRAPALQALPQNLSSPAPPLNRFSEPQPSQLCPRTSHPSAPLPALPLNLSFYSIFWQCHQWNRCKCSQSGCLLVSQSSDFHIFTNEDTQWTRIPGMFTYLWTCPNDRVLQQSSQAPHFV